jgi:hypothetical protein
MKSKSPPQRFFPFFTEENGHRPKEDLSSYAPINTATRFYLMKFNKLCIVEKALIEYTKNRDRETLFIAHVIFFLKGLI